MSEPGKPSNRKVRNFLIFGEFQMYYAGYMAAVSVALTAGLGWLVYHFNSEAARVVDLRAFDPADIEAQTLAATFHRNERNLIIGLVAFGVVLAAVLAIWQIVTTHKVAGPLYYIAHQTKRIKDGFLGTLHPLRKGDMLHGFFETFRDMHGAMRDKAQKEAEQLTRLAGEAEKAGQGKIAEELRALAKQREDSLK
jgi:hypothetical protein